MNDAEPRVFCAPWFKPVIVVTVLAVVVAIAWTLGGHSRPTTGCASPKTTNGVVPAATAPPITAGVRAPHPDFGHCTRCHEVRGAAGGAARAGAVPAATAPPIAENAKLTHPDWGACKKCHQINPVTPVKTVAFTSDSPMLLGARVEKLTPKRADLLEMEGVKGPVITQVVEGSPAAVAGLKVDDAILKVDNQDITSAAELRAAIAAAKPGAKVKLQITRGERKKNIFVKLPATGADSGTLAAATGTPTGSPGALLAAAGPGATLAPVGPAVAPAPYLWRVAIAATGPSREAQVAPVFSAAPFFLLRDGPEGQWFVLPNPSPGAVGRGQTAAALLTAQSVGVVIAGNVGPGAFAALRGAGVQVYSGTFGAIEQVYRSYRRGQLIPATSTVVASPSPPNLAGVLAIAATGPGLGYAVAPSVGTAPYLILYNLGTGSAQVLANPGTATRPLGEAEIAQRLIDRGVNALVAGDLSPTAVAALAQLRVMGFAGVAGTVADAVGLYVQGRLRAATLPLGVFPGVSPPGVLRPRG
ncbi:MAG: PDZ domain-containing protein [Deltaproteobacteria bacterium]|nr:PDZ domain-containing protein [Deltaproteobacteria bacterium]